MTVLDPNLHLRNGRLLSIKTINYTHACSIRLSAWTTGICTQHTHCCLRNVDCIDGWFVEF